MKPFSFLEFEGLPILEQLEIEEALLRTDDQNWCIINTSSPPAIVLGISANPAELVHLERANGVPLIKRFSGGGTVYIDQETIFVTFICGESSIRNEPHAIMKWSEKLYHSFFPKGFELRENDYVFGEKKFGGNAQYIRKGRWLHHTSFLWDYDPTKMDILKMPIKRPGYRGERAHHEFLCRLSDFHENKKAFLESLKGHLKKELYGTKVPFSQIQEILKRPYRKSVTKLEFT